MNTEITLEEAQELANIFPTDVSNTYARLMETYKRIIAGTETDAKGNSFWIPAIYVESVFVKFNTGYKICEAEINEQPFAFYFKPIEIKPDEIYVNLHSDVCLSRDIMLNRWKFRYKKQLEHFIKYFHKELIVSELGGLYTLTFLNER